MSRTDLQIHIYSYRISHYHQINKHFVSRLKDLKGRHIISGKLHRTICPRGDQPHGFMSSLKYIKHAHETDIELRMKASFSFNKITPKTHKLLPYIQINHCTSLSLWLIILDKINFVKGSHRY